MLKIIFPASCLFLAPSLPTLAQQPASAVALSVGVVNSYHFAAASSPLANYYALGSKVQVVLHDKWLLGFTQLSSLAPTNLLPSAALEGRNTQLTEYAVRSGRQWRFATKTYVLSSLQAGFGTLRPRDRVAQEGLTGNRASFLTAGANADLGYHLTPFLALEAGAGYRRYFHGTQLPVAATELSNLSVGLSLVGTLGLTKQH